MILRKAVRPQLLGFVFLISKTTVALGAASTASVTVDIMDVVNQKGHLIVAVCTRSEYPSRCHRVVIAAAKTPKTTVNIPEVETGTYAVVAFHDENDNHRLDKDASGLPMEGIGFSRDATGHFGPPLFDDAAINVTEHNDSIAIHMSY